LFGSAAHAISRLLLLGTRDRRSIPKRTRRSSWPSVRELLVNPSAGLVFLVCEPDSRVGYLVLSFDFSLEYGGRNAWIDELFIRPEFRGKGIGSKVLDFAIQAAHECGAKVLHLEVNRGNPAIDLYRRHGFEDHNRYLFSKWLTGDHGENP